MSNISPDLADSIRDYVMQRSRLEFLDGAAVECIVDAVAEAFVGDTDSTWWWESVRAPSRVEPYNGKDGLNCVHENLCQLAGPLSLVVTDDERPPWIGVRGPLDSLGELLREHQYFEYFIVDDSLSWILFDTHDNSLVVAGVLA